MNRSIFRAAAFVAFGALSFEAQSNTPPALTGFPFTNEVLNYSLNWPSGASLGEAHLSATRAGAGWNFSFSVDGGIPGFQVRDVYHGDATTDLCTTSFDRDTMHGARKANEKETVDAERGVVTRVTAGGGQSDIGVPKCVKDALTYLFYAREELGQGRVPAAEQILFGGLYQVSLVYAGAPVIPVGGKQEQSDQVTATVKGPSSSLTFDAYFARDAARTPLLVKVPFAMGTFSMELVR